MASKENLNPLKTLVISMGFILIGGTVLLAGLVWKKVSAQSAGTYSACAGGQVDLKGRGMVVGSVLDGKILRMTLEKKKGTTEIVTIDTCAGKITSAVTIESDSREK